MGNTWVYCDNHGKGYKVTCALCREKRQRLRLERGRRMRAKLWDVVFALYGQRCACCGETGRQFLTIDHVNGDGLTHRTATGKSRIAGQVIRRLIRRQGYSPQYQILCYNCNLATGHYGWCHDPTIVRLVRPTGRGRPSPPPAASGVEGE